MEFHEHPPAACGQCLDDPGGWIVLECPRWHCGSKSPKHYAHTFAVKCPCWFQKHREHIQKQLQSALAEGQEVPKVARDLQDVDAGIYPWRSARTYVARWNDAYNEQQRGSAA